MENQNIAFAGLFEVDIRVPVCPSCGQLVVGILCIRVDGDRLLVGIVENEGRDLLPGPSAAPLHELGSIKVSDIPGLFSDGRVN